MWIVKREVDLVISDIGGVLVDTFAAIVAVIKDVAEKEDCYGGKEERIYDVLGTSIREYIRAYLPEGCKDKTDACYEAFEKVFPVPVLDMLKPFYGVDQTLDYLHSQGVVIGVVSCLKMRAIDMCLERLRFKDFRDRLSYERTEKEDAKPINDLLKTYGVSNNRCAYIGDTLADIQMAKTAGVISVAVKSGALGQKKPEMLTNEKPDYLLEDFRSLPSVVLAMELREHNQEST